MEGQLRQVRETPLPSLVSSNLNKVKALLSFFLRFSTLCFSCKSFDYGRGYNTHGSFQSDLYTKDVGQCKRWSVGKSKYGIKSCPFDYFEKEEASTGSVTTVARLIILLSLSGVMSVMI